MADLTVAVIVCAYTMERMADIERAMASVEAQRRAADEVILVVDHNEELQEAVRGRVGGVDIIANAAPKGLSGARNSGVDRTTADVIAFLDDDAEAAPDWLETMLSWYLDPAVIGVGGLSEAVWRSARPAWFPREFDWVVGCSYEGLPTVPADVRNMIGSNMSFRSEVFERVGGFDHSIGRIDARPVGCEETELCIRAARAFPEARIVYDPAVRVRHHVPQARGTWRYFLSRCYAEGLSKALVAGLVGRREGLATERSYVWRTLPLGCVGGVGDALRMRRPAPLLRVAAIAGGLLVTVMGFVIGSTKSRWRSARSDRRRAAVSAAGPER